jgi:hypothetical protein
MTSNDFIEAALSNPANRAIVHEIAALELPDAWVVAGCLVQTVWNVLTGRPLTHGISDYDVFYYDSDTSWAAEDAVIRQVERRLASVRVKIETRNQARVHLWYQQKHGRPYAPLKCSTDGIDRFLTRNTQVGIRKASEGYEMYAPHGVSDAAELIVRPNPTVNFSAENYAAKALRWKALWPEISVYPADAT